MRTITAVQSLGAFNGEFFKKRFAVFIFLITFIIHSPLLFNHFHGDDVLFVGGNTFYHSWKNIPRLAEKRYIANPQEIFFYAGPGSDIGPGNSSYRPITDLTYFFDYYLFQARPYGSHLINILIHCINSVLVYAIVRQIFACATLGLFTGLLFSLHPIQSEAVASVSCRFDLLAAMFVLSSFYFWIKFKLSGYSGNQFYFGSLAMYFFALFSKESACMLPFAIFLFDQALVSGSLGLKQRVIYYIGFIPILLFYIYCDVIAFPAINYSLHWLGGTFVNHCLIMGYIGYAYLINIIFPWTVKVIPGLYCPDAPGVFSLVTAGMGAAFIILIISLFVLWRNSKEGFFFLLWAVLFYLPVSNLIPIESPMASRFMYLPSVGLLAVLVFFFHKMFGQEKHPWNLSSIFFCVGILICVTKTAYLSKDWDTNFTEKSAWIRDYPANARGYALLGLQYFDAGLFEKAEVYLEKGVYLGNKKPKEGLALAQCYVRLRKFAKAETLLKQIIVRFPAYPDPYFCLGRLYYDLNIERKAQAMLEKALKLNPKFEAAKVLLKKVDFLLQAKVTSH